MEKKLVALSIGSNNISAAIAKDDEEFTILDTISRPSKGIKKGNIIDKDLATESIVEVLEELSKINLEKVASVYISLPAKDARIIKNTGVYLSEYKSTVLTKKEITNAYLNGKKVITENDEYIVDAIINKIRVNDNEVSECPIGIATSSLEMDLDIIVAKKEFVDSMKEIFDRIGCEINGFLVGVEALKEIFLVDDNTQNNLIVDFGAEKTEFAYFEKGRLENIGSIPLGGLNITQDLSIVTNYDKDLMEEVKKANSERYSSLRKSFAKIEVLDETIEADLFYEIINARFEEILNYLKKELEYLGIYDKIENITILGDGIGSFEEIDLLIEEILEKKANIFTKNELNIQKSSIITPIAIVKEVYDRLKLLSDDSKVIEKTFKEEIKSQKPKEEPNDDIKKVKKKGLSKVLGFLGDIF